MELIPTHDEVVELLRTPERSAAAISRIRTDCIRRSICRSPWQCATTSTPRFSSVGLSRKLRANPELHAMIPELSIVAPATGGLPVAYGVCEALRAHQVYWAERKIVGQPMRFRQYMEQHKGEKVLLVDDILRTGAKLTELKTQLNPPGLK